MSAMQILSQSRSRFIVVLFAFFVPILSTIYLQVTSKSGYNSLSGLPYKDAINWSQCAKSLALTHTFPSNDGSWCLRRPTFIEFSAFLYKFTHSLPIISLIFALLFAISMAWTINVLIKFIGFLPSFGLSLLIIAYWHIYASNLFLSESLGLTFGVAALGVTIRAIQTKDFVWMLLCAFFISTTQLIRPGNLLILITPFLMVIVFNQGLYRKIKCIALMLAVTALPFATLSLLAKLRGIAEYNNSGNAWSSFYGLLNNNSSWTSAYDLPAIHAATSDAELSNIIKQASLQLFRNNPADLFYSIFKNLYTMLFKDFPFILPVWLPESYSKIFGTLTLIVALFGIGRYLRKSHDRSKFIHIWIILSTVLFFAISWKSDPSRTLSPGLPLFFTSLYIAIFRKSESRTKIWQERRSGVRFTSILSLAIFSFLILNSLFVYSPIQYYKDKPCSTIGSFRLHALDIRRTDEIDLVGMYSWSDPLQTLTLGYLIQGLEYSKAGVTAHNIFIESSDRLSKRLLENMCFIPVDSSYFSHSLDLLGFVEFKFTSS